MPISDKQHPFWRWATLTVTLIAGVSALYVTSTTFDSTEAISIITMIAAALTSETARQYITRSKDPAP